MNMYNSRLNDGSSQVLSVITDFTMLNLKNICWIYLLVTSILTNYLNGQTSTALGTEVVRDNDILLTILDTCK